VSSSSGPLTSPPGEEESYLHRFPRISSPGDVNPRTNLSTEVDVPRSMDLLRVELPNFKDKEEGVTEAISAASNNCLCLPGGFTPGTPVSTHII